MEHAVNLEKISFLHSGLPDCVSPIVSTTSEFPEYPGIHGTGFFVRKRDKLAFLTARHCLLTNQIRDPKVIANQLHIPYSLDGKKTSGDDYVQFDNIASFRHETEEIPGSFIDLAVLTITVGIGTWQEKHLKSRAAKLPPTGEYLENFSKIPTIKDAFDSNHGPTLVMIGYPHEGTSTGVEIEDLNIHTQLVRTYGRLQFGTYPHTMSMKNITWARSPNGFSGSPVFLKIENKHGSQFALAGIAIGGGNRSIELIRVDVIVKAFESIQIA